MNAPSINSHEARRSRGAAAALLAALPVLALASCAPRESSFYRDLRYALPGAPGKDAPAGYTDVPVYFATNRSAEDGYPYYGRDPASEPAAGSMVVRIDKRRPIGGMNPFFQPFARERAAQEARLVGEPDTAASYDQFIRGLQELNATKPLLIYVHGFNVDFPGAVSGAGRLAHDLGGGMVPVAFTWPAAGRFEQYLADENNAHLSGAALADFLRRLRERPTPGAGIHLLAHSMGSRVTLYALESLEAAPTLTTLNFAAPDVDALEFRSGLVPVIGKGIAGRTTVYLGERDRALAASHRLHSRTLEGDRRRGRAGQAGRLLAPVPGCDTVDVTLAEFSPTLHGYAATNRAVLNDLYLSLVHGLTPDRRNLFRAATANDETFWLIRP